jgi:hypothetical protein
MPEIRLTAVTGGVTTFDRSGDAAAPRTPNPPPGEELGRWTGAGRF